MFTAAKTTIIINLIWLLNCFLGITITTTKIFDVYDDDDVFFSIVVAFLLIVNIFFLYILCIIIFVVGVKNHIYSNLK